jgi:adenine-specific DNA-methyltransferase
MIKEELDAHYISCFAGCEQFLIKKFDISIEVFRDFVVKLLKTQELKTFYRTLCDQTVGCNHLTVISDAKEFIHIIDHYDGTLHADKRDKTGSYYTPEPVVLSMVEGVLTLPEISGKIKDQALITTLEPSCGTMIFIRHLCQAVYTLTEDVSYLKSFVKGLTTVDIQAKALILGVLGMLSHLFELTGEWQYTWHVRCEDALSIEDLDGSMDIVIGNPPYLGEKGNKDYFRYLKTLPTIAKYYEGRMDLYYFFIHRGIEALKPSGVLSFITTNYFISSDSGVKLRSHIQDETVFRKLVDHSDDDVFKSARGQHNLSFVLQKEKLNTNHLCQVSLSGQESRTIEAYKLYDHRGLINLVNDNEDYRLLEKIKGNSSGLLSDYFDVKQGIVSGADAVTNRMIAKGGIDLSGGLEKGSPIYVFPKSDVKLFDGPWQLFYKNSDIGPYKIVKEASYEIYYVTGDTQPSDQGLNYLERFKAVLSSRREVELGYRKWYELQWPRTSDLFEQAKLVMPQRSKKNTFAYSENPVYGSADIYYIIHQQQDSQALKYLNGVLNSKLYYYWLYNRGKKKGDLLELYSTPIKSLPIIHYKDLAWQREIVEAVDEILLMDSQEACGINKCIKKIDSFVYEGFSLGDDEIELVERLYDKMQK